MTKLYISFMLVFITACAPAPLGSRQDVLLQKEYALPSSYIRCPESFYWNTAEFHQQQSLKYGSQDYSNSLIKVEASDWNDYSKSGSSYSYDSRLYSLSDAQRQTCDDIYKKITLRSDEYFAGYMLKQHFPLAEINNLKENDDLKPIQEDLLILEHFHYKYRDNSWKEIFYTLEIPVKVKCVTPWSVKKDSENIYFKTPDDKCNFELNDFEMNLESGEKIALSLRGYYQKDPEAPLKSTIVKIVNYGFKKAD